MGCGARYGQSVSISSRPKGTACAARTTFEKLADAATVHRFTGVAPSVALHIPWDKVDDYEELRAYADSLGIAHERGEQIQHYC